MGRTKSNKILYVHVSKPNRYNDNSKEREDKISIKKKFVVPKSVVCADSYVLCQLKSLLQSLPFLSILSRLTYAVIDRRHSDFFMYTVLRSRGFTYFWSTEAINCCALLRSFWLNKHLGMLYYILQVYENVSQVQQ